MTKRWHYREGQLFDPLTAEVIAQSVSEEHIAKLQALPFVLVTLKEIVRVANEPGIAVVTRCHQMKMLAQRALAESLVSNSRN